MIIDYTITIKNLETGETSELYKCVATKHSQWIHDQLGTSNEIELQSFLDNCSLFDWYDENGNHKGFDSNGLSMTAHDPIPFVRYQSYDGEGRDLGMLTLEEAELYGENSFDVLTKTISVDMEGQELTDYYTGEYIREATCEEVRASVYASQHDGGAGVIKVEDRSCYVI